jgi:hypothetical protein
MFNATLNNISAISSRSVLLVEETGVPRENHRPVIDKLFHIMLYRVHHKNKSIKKYAVRISIFEIFKIGKII